MTTPYKTSFWEFCLPFTLCIYLRIGIKSSFCPCFVYGRNHYRLEHGNGNNYSSCNGWCCAWCSLAALGGFSFVLQILDRHTLQEKYVSFKSTLTQGLGRDGNNCTGYMGSFCCPCCELMQTSKELDYILTENNRESQRYRQQQPMVAHPKTYN
ncbi:PLAC8 family protein [Rutstroemia sp. NJR-2017a WRK4]|nr:PLAC8 family protein [Rutstroemia sp. NJR-2017a WRK4]